MTLEDGGSYFVLRANAASAVSAGQNVSVEFMGVEVQHIVAQQ